MTKVTDKNLEELFHLSEMSEDEKAILFNDIGSLVLESATLRFLAESDEEVGERFSHVVDAYADREDMVPALIDNFPAFSIILEEEAAAFRDDARRVLS